MSPTTHEGPPLTDSLRGDPPESMNGIVSPMTKKPSPSAARARRSAMLSHVKRSTPSREKVSAAIAQVRAKQSPDPLSGKRGQDENGGSPRNSTPKLASPQGTRRVATAVLSPSRAPLTPKRQTHSHASDTTTPGKLPPASPSATSTPATETSSHKNFFFNIFASRAADSGATQKSIAEKEESPETSTPKRHAGKSAGTAASAIQEDAFSTESSDDEFVDASTLNNVGAFIDSLHRKKESSKPTLQEIGHFNDHAATSRDAPSSNEEYTHKILAAVSEDYSLPSNTEAGVAAFIDNLTNKNLSPKSAPADKSTSGYLYISSSDESGVTPETQAEIKKYIEVIAASRSDSAAGETGIEHSADLIDSVMALRKGSSEDSFSSEEASAVLDKVLQLRDTFSVDGPMDSRADSDLSVVLSRPSSHGASAEETAVHSSPVSSGLIGEECMTENEVTPIPSRDTTVSVTEEKATFDESLVIPALDEVATNGSERSDDKAEPHGPVDPFLRIKKLMEGLSERDVAQTLAFFKEAAVVAQGGSKKKQSRLLMRARKDGVPARVLNAVAAEFLELEQIQSGEKESLKTGLYKQETKKSDISHAPSDERGEKPINFVGKNDYTIELDDEEAAEIASFFSKMAVLKSSDSMPDADLEAISTFVKEDSADDDKSVESDADEIEKDLYPQQSGDSGSPWWESNTEGSVDEVVNKVASAVKRKEQLHQQESVGLKVVTTQPSPVIPCTANAALATVPTSPAGMLLRELERRFHDSEAWMIRQVALYWRNPWDVYDNVSKAGAVPVPKELPPIGGVAAAKKLSRWSSRRSSIVRTPVRKHVRSSYKDRTSLHPGYMGVDVYSLYELSFVGKGDSDPVDSVPWEFRDVKQLFFHEQSVSVARNWFGSLLRKRGNDKYREPVALAKSMEMPMERIAESEWSEDWYVTWQARKTLPRASHSKDDGDASKDTDDNGSSLRNDYSGSMLSDGQPAFGSGDETASDDEWWDDDAPECGTFVNVRQKIGERVSLITPDYTSRLRRSRWRKKYFPRGTFPYK